MTYLEELIILSFCNMTLEDFFTLTEMKNGLTTCARIEELICVMQKLNCVTNNVGDAARQWSTAASTLACTQNRECLSLFVHLNVLGFLNHWLQEPVKCSSDVGDGEELINTLIGSLDKLPTNPEKLSSSGIFLTIEKLFGHTNVNINDYSPSAHAYKYPIFSSISYHSYYFSTRLISDQQCLGYSPSSSPSFLASRSSASVDYQHQGQTNSLFISNPNTTATTPPSSPGILVLSTQFGNSVLLVMNFSGLKSKNLQLPPNFVASQSN